MPQDPSRRQELRAAIELKVEYTRLNTFFHDYTKNISKGGTFIKTERPLPLGTPFVFNLIVPKLNLSLELRGEVRWVGQPQEPGMGIRFVYKDEADRLAVQRAVEKTMVASLGPLIYSQLCLQAENATATSGSDDEPG